MHEENDDEEDDEGKNDGNGNGNGKMPRNHDDDESMPKNDEEDDEKPSRRERKVHISYACEDCDYRWDDIIIKKRDEIEDDLDRDVICFGF